MRQLRAVLLSLGALTAFAQTPADSMRALANQRVALAEQQLQRVQQLVDAGAESRLRMQQAQQDVDDAKDAAILAETLYSDLSKKSPDDPALQQMIAAAQSRLDRQQARLDEAQKLVTSGLAPQAYLTPIQEELTSRQIALDLARSRVQSVKDSAALATLRDSGAHLQTAQPPQQAKASEYRDLIRPG